MTISEAMRDIITGAQVPAFNEKNVSITGLVTEVAPGGSGFTIRAADNVIVPILLSSKLDNPVEGYVEVHGVAKGKSVHAQDFMCFTNSDFDANSHNKLCKFLYSVPNLWKLK